MPDLIYRNCNSWLPVLRKVYLIYRNCNSWLPVLRKVYLIYRNTISYCSHRNTKSEVSHRDYRDCAPVQTNYRPITALTSPRIQPVSDPFTFHFHILFLTPLRGVRLPPTRTLPLPTNQLPTKSRCVTWHSQTLRFPNSIAKLLNPDSISTT
jgi:hypothetical protein